MKIIFTAISAALGLLAAASMTLNLAQGDLTSAIWCGVIAFVLSYFALFLWLSGDEL